MSKNIVKIPMKCHKNHVAKSIVVCKNRSHLDGVKYGYCKSNYGETMENRVERNFIIIVKTRQAIDL